MSDKTTERLEQEAREALIAADLSARMKQWRRQPPPSGGQGGGRLGLILLLLLLAFGGAAWWLWPEPDYNPPPPPREQPPGSPGAAPEQRRPAAPASRPQPPVARQKSAPRVNRYLALAQSNYTAPDFASDIRGDAAAGEDALNQARQALAGRRFAEALQALHDIPSDYRTDAAYLRGHALFGLKRYAEAAATFGQLGASIRYGEAAQWYETLALLPDFEKSKALITSRLKNIADDDGHMFQHEAERLLEDI